MFPQNKERALARIKNTFARVLTYRQLFYDFLIDHIRSNQCVLCSAAAQTHCLCRHCLADLPWLTDACPLCALPMIEVELESETNPEPTFVVNTVCIRCQQSPPPWQSCKALFRYEFPVDRLIAAFKYQGRLLLADFFGQLLSHLSATTPSIQLIVPVPLHQKRIGQRGYNQSALLARVLSKALNTPLALHRLQRRRDTVMQKTLSLDARRANLAGAFVWCGAPLAGAHILLIDDVMTTGATMQALTQTLHEAGAGTISIQVIARTLPP